MRFDDFRLDFRIVREPVFLDSQLEQFRRSGTRTPRPISAMSRLWRRAWMVVQRSDAGGARRMLNGTSLGSKVSAPLRVRDGLPIEICAKEKTRMRLLDGDHGFSTASSRKSRLSNGVDPFQNFASKQASGIACRRAVRSHTYCRFQPALDRVGSTRVSGGSTFCGEGADGRVRGATRAGVFSAWALSLSIWMFRKTLLAGLAPALAALSTPCLWLLGYANKNRKKWRCAEDLHPKRARPGAVRSR